jgi:hypothetical protein
VKECNARDAQHVHAQATGGLTARLFADVTDDEDLLRQALAALNSQVCAELPLEYHAWSSGEVRGGD